MKRLALAITLTACAFGQQPGQKPAAQVIYASSLPAACNPTLGQIYFKTTAPIGMYECLTTNTWSQMAAGGGGISGLTSPKVPKATSATTIADSAISDDGTNVYINEPLDIKAQPFTIELPNSSTGTTTNKLAKVVNTAGVLQAQIITTSAADQAAALGCVISGGGTTGTAIIMIAGTGSCYFDGATTAGHIAVPSATSAGALTDTGSASMPATGEVLATVGATNACGSPPCLIAGNLFLTPDLVATGANGNGGGSGNGGGAKQQLHSVTFVFNGGTSTLTTGDSGLYPGVGAGTGTISRVDISGAGTAGAACSATVDIWKRNAAIPTSSQKISASAPPTLSSANLAQNGSRSGWINTTVAANDVFGASLATNTGCITLLVQIYYQ